MSAYVSGNVKGDKVSKGEHEYYTFEFVGKKFAIKVTIHFLLACQYILHFRFYKCDLTSHCTLQSSSGKYLSPDGIKGNLKAKSDKITPREQFEMFHCDPQISIKAHNKKYVSCQERNIMCNR